MKLTNSERISGSTQRKGEVRAPASPEPIERMKKRGNSLMQIACKQYKDVYYIKPDAALHNGESSTADGVHPNDNGYSLWEASIEKPILKILKKYGIKRTW